jgi:hypothetical protein
VILYNIVIVIRGRVPRVVGTEAGSCSVPRVVNGGFGLRGWLRLQIKKRDVIQKR